MKNLYKQKRQEGFTIIEVMIVLAIAAVILLIVLLAVPALQRNSRNTQRTNDAAQFAAAVNDCISNQNGDASKCHTVGTSNVDIDLTKLGQLNNAPAYDGTAAFPSDSNSIVWAFSKSCSGNTVQGASNRSFVVLFNVEATSGVTARCIDS